MKLTIIRHCKVDHTWKEKCTSKEFDEECALYDKAPIVEMSGAERPDNAGAAEKIYISALPRTYQTAEVLFGKRDFCKTELINEVPLRSAFDAKKAYPLWFWNIAGRLQWMFNCKRQPETKRKTCERAEKFAKELAECKGDCIIVTHGFFMHTLIKTLKKRGFAAGSTSLHYKNNEAVVLNKLGYHM